MDLMQILCGYHMDSVDSGNEIRRFHEFCMKSTDFNDIHISLPDLKRPRDLKKTSYISTSEMKSLYISFRRFYFGVYLNELMQRSTQKKGTLS